MDDPGPPAAADEPHAPRPAVAWLDRTIEKKGLKPRYAAYVIISFWAVAALSFGVIEYLVDRATFDTVWLGIWWAIETVTTVGYGDVVPESATGKVFAAILMLGGLSLLSVVTAAITSAFLSRAEEMRRASGDDPVVEGLREIESKIIAMQADIDRLTRDRDD